MAVTKVEPATPEQGDMTIAVTGVEVGWNPSAQEPFVPSSETGPATLVPDAFGPRDIAAGEEEEEEDVEFDDDEEDEEFEEEEDFDEDDDADDDLDELDEDLEEEEEEDF